IPSSLGRQLLPSLISEFQRAWPNIRIKVHGDDSSVDLIGDGYDLAINVSEKLKDSNLVCRRLGTTQTVLAASPGYLDQFGVPESFPELKQHRCLGFGSMLEDDATWSFAALRTGNKEPGQFPVVADNVDLLIDAACQDIGIICVPQAFILRELEQGKLRILLPGTDKAVSLGVFVVYPHRNTATKVKVLVDFMEAEMRALGVFDE
ncbi:MAG: substrate binding domain-containing protein, partial [Woeseiaceae bacterium]|nr:substrate binding domain-containing protein [Woeseiaceae bacterium]